MVVFAIAVATSMSVIAADAVKADAKKDATPTVKTETVVPAVKAEIPAVKTEVAVPAVKVEVCADCIKLNKDNKKGDVAKLCPACTKKANEAKKTEVKPTEVKK